MLKRTEFAEALGRAVAAGMIEAENAGIFGSSREPKHPRAQAAKTPRKPRRQPSASEVPPAQPPRDIHEAVDEALERSRRETAYSLDHDEEPTPEELARLETMFGRTGETRELDGRALMKLERELRVAPDERDKNKGTYIPDAVEDLAAHVVVQGRVK